MSNHFLTLRVLLIAKSRSYREISSKIANLNFQGGNFFLLEGRGLKKAGDYPKLGGWGSLTMVNEGNSFHRIFRVII